LNPTRSPLFIGAGAIHMNVLGYWASLLAIVFMIVGFLVGVALLVGALDLIYPRTSPPPIWMTDLWKRYKIAVVLVGLVCFVTGVVVFARHDARRSRQRAEADARRHGWAFAQYDETLEKAVAVFLPGLNVHVYHVRTTQTTPFPLYLFDCTYLSKAAASRQRQSLGTASFAQSPRFRRTGPPVEIYVRDWTELLTPHKVDMGTSAFAETFVVVSDDPISAKEMVNTSIQEILLAHFARPLYRPVTVVLGNGGALALTAQTAERERLHDLIDLMRELEFAAR
jgi:chloramphenicol 3-O-phosphotransferase